ncbi:MAG: peptide-methionine (S)-S-oxide reductase MsrA [Bacteroidetes bacterium]|nr:peptide-methionine (S)-S-oxide reductase MsrA [Bacteroidota bacterium]MDA1210501.1 peptide-methionine (S)-S-oxide reductase MsrA [Bacteroidota bacterium]
MEKIVLAGGCFWCTEAVFTGVRGVISIVSGFSGGAIKNPAYREVCQGRTGHAECIELTYDPKELSLEVILDLFFKTHDPTTLNRQGHDVGTHYRSAIFYTTEDQKSTVGAYILALEQNSVYPSPIVTEVAPFDAFYPAEVEHQEYYKNNPYQPYCQFVIKPKLDKKEEYLTKK